MIKSMMNSILIIGFKVSHVSLLGQNILYNTSSVLLHIKCNLKKLNFLNMLSFWLGGNLLDKIDGS